jgi:MFS family permease
MANPYRDLFRAPGTASFAVAGFLARLPLPMTGIGIITMVSQLRGSYGLAGGVAATFVFTYALAAPQISRLVDRKGQGRVLPAAAGASVSGLLILLACSYWRMPDWTLFAAAILSGFMPSMSAMARARWTEIYSGQPQLKAAYSLETVLDEMSFIAGPPLSVGLGVALFPQAGPLAAAVLLAAGVALFTAQTATEPGVKPVAPLPGENSAVFRNPVVLALTLMMVAMGGVVGSIDIGSVAFADQQGRPAAASFVLSSYAVGSCAAGLLFGALRIDIPHRHLLVLGGLATAAATVPLLLAGNIMALSLAVLVGGLFFAPTMIVAMELVEQAVPGAKLTEGLTWLLAGLNTGTALGAALAGQIVDAFDVRAGFFVAVGAGLAILMLAVLGSRLIARRGGRGLPEMRPHVC